MPLIIHQPDMTNYGQLITVDQLKPSLAEPAWRVVDCRFDLMAPDRGYDEYLHGHVPGALYAHLDEDLAGPATEATGRHPLPSVEVFAETLSAWGIGNDTQVIVYDHASGAIAARLWWMLKWVGHDDVAVLDGGYAAWTNAGYPIATAEESVPKTHFEPAPDSAPTISTAALVAALDSGDAPVLVDARDGERFSGQAEPIDAVAGHVPGAVNYPFASSLNADGSFKSPEVLRAGWSEVLKDDPPAPWIAMCGSGVTACHLVLSAELAGFPPPCVYVGSWSEWIRDPDRRVATGDA